MMTVSSMDGYKHSFLLSCHFDHWIECIWAYPYITTKTTTTVTAKASKILGPLRTTILICSARLSIRKPECLIIITGCDVHGNTHWGTIIPLDQSERRKKKPLFTMLLRLYCMKHSIDYTSDPLKVSASLWLPTQYYLMEYLTLHLHHLFAVISWRLPFSCDSGILSQIPLLILSWFALPFHLHLVWISCITAIDFHNILLYTILNGNKFLFFFLVNSLCGKYLQLL